MTDELKRKVLIFTALAAILLVLLAGALPGLKLQPGVPLPTVPTGPAATPPETIPLVSITITTFLKVALAVVLAAAFIVAIYKLLRGSHWKELVRPLLTTIIGSLVVIGILSLLLKLNVNTKPNAPEILPTEMPAPRVDVAVPQMDFTWLAVIALALGVIGFGAWLALHRRQPPPAMIALQLEAERALQDILTGSDVRSVIIQCYLQMSRALQEEQEITREESMTAREFEKLLDRKSFPPEPVHQLTRLFELARYASGELGAGDESQAVSCLEQIVAFCRQGGKLSHSGAAEAR